MATRTLRPSSSSGTWPVRPPPSGRLKKRLAPTVFWRQGLHPAAVATPTVTGCWPSIAVTGSSIADRRGGGRPFRPPLGGMTSGCLPPWAGFPTAPLCSTSGRAQALSRCLPSLWRPRFERLSSSSVPTATGYNRCGTRPRINGARGCHLHPDAPSQIAIGERRRPRPFDWRPRLCPGRFRPPSRSGSDAERPVRRGLGGGSHAFFIRLGRCTLHAASSWRRPQRLAPSLPLRSSTGDSRQRARRRRRTSPAGTKTVAPREFTKSRRRRPCQGRRQR